MKAFIDRVFKSKKQKQKELIDEIADTEVTDVVEENKKIITKQLTETLKEKAELKDKVIYSKPGHYFPDCNCFKCIRWRNQNA
jgi:hypothetical protein